MKNRPHQRLAYDNSNGPAVGVAKRSEQGGAAHDSIPRRKKTRSCLKGVGAESLSEEEYNEDRGESRNNGSKQATANTILPVITQENHVFPAETSRRQVRTR